MKSNSSLNSLNISFPVFKETLKNGLKILIIEDHSLPLVAYSTTFMVGSRNENLPKIKTGTSHLFEHLMFNGSKKYPKGDFDSIIESCGGYSNAWTSRDQTTYYELFTPENIKQIIDLEIDRFNNLSITNTILNAEKDIVKEERRLRIDNSLSGKMWELLYKNAYGKQAYHSPVLGWMKDINSITLNDCNYFYKTFYSINNAVITIAGDINIENTITLIKNAYGSIPMQNTPKFQESPNQINKSNKIITLDMPAEMEMVLMGYPGSIGNQSDSPIIDILLYILTEGETSRLYRKLVYEKEHCTDIFGDFHWGFSNELITFGYRIHPGKNFKKVLTDFDVEILNICNKKINDTELQKAKNGIITSIVEELTTIANKAAKVVQFETLFGNYNKLFKLINIYNCITINQVHEIAQKYLNNNNRTIIHLIPEKL